MSCPALKICDLSVSHPASGREVVSTLSFTVPGGSTVALVGESGSGKTMTAMAVMGLLPSGFYRASGTVSVDEHPTENLTPEEYRRLRNTSVSLIMQNPMSAFDPVLSIFYHFRETLASHGMTDKAEIRSRALAGLSEAGFDDPARILELYPFQMSGGMLQRVMLALALIASPPLVIADEATCDLDVLAQARALKLLKDHCQRRHLALLLITHDLSVAAEFADEIVVLKEGRLAETGPTRRVFAAPKSDYTARLLAAHRALYTPRYLNIMAELSRQGDL